MIEQNNCPICNSTKVVLRFKLPTPYLDRKYIYNIYKCKECGFHFSRGPVDNEILLKIYNTNFHDSEQQYAKITAGGFSCPKNKKFPIVYNALQRTDWLHSLKFKGRLLDVGAGRGYFVKAANKYFVAEGIELSQKAEEYGKELGVNLYSGDFLTYDFFSNQYNVITLWDVLASLKNPHKILQHVHSLLNQNGIIVMTLPRVNGWFPRLMGKLWPLWIPPVNLSYFSDKSIEVLLKKNGFESKIIKCLPKKVAVSFLITKLARTLGGNRFLHSVATIIPVKWSININLNDIVTVVAVRKDI